MRAEFIRKHRLLELLADMDDDDLIGATRNGGGGLLILDSDGDAKAVVDFEDGGSVCRLKSEV